MEGIHKLNEIIYKKMVQLYSEEKFQGSIDLGVSLLENARRLKDRASEKKALEVLAYASYQIIDYVNAMYYIIQFSKIIEEEKDVTEKFKSYSVFIGMFTRQGEYDDAYRYLQKVESMTMDEPYIDERIRNENNYGFFHNSFNEYFKAIPHLLEALELAGSSYGQDVLPFIYSNMAKAYLRTDNTGEAKKMLESLASYVDTDNGGILLIEYYTNLAELMMVEDNPMEALNLIKTAKMIADRHGYIFEQEEALKLQAKVYKNMKDYENAYRTMDKLLLIQEQLGTMARKSAVTRLKVDYDINRRQIEASILREQNAILEDKNRKIQIQTNELEHLNEILSRQNDDLHQSAIEDYLTGVYNRKYLALKFREEFSMAANTGGNLACIIFDIDRFKSINDTYGHLIGDEMIKHVSSLCEEALDTDSIIGRFGGDEFIILMVDATLEDARDKSDELNDLLSTSPLLVDGEQVYASLSLGVADNHHLSPRTTDEMIHIADQGLYLAKERGRNQCAVYEGDQQEG